jgi:hypothetical protein
MIQDGLELRLETGKIFLHNLSEHSIFAEKFSMKFFELHLSPVKIEPAFDYRHKTLTIAPGEEVVNK